MTGYEGGTPMGKSALALMNPEFNARDVFDKTTPRLVWHRFFPRVRANAKAITYLTDTYSDNTDVAKRIPMAWSPGSEIAKVKISDVTNKVATMRGKAIGYALAEDLDMYPNPDVDEVARIRQRVSYWLAEYMNNLVLDDITNNCSTGASGTGITADSVIQGILSHEESTYAGYNTAQGFIQIKHDGATYGWSISGANPVQDILEWKRCMSDQEPAATGERYNYNLTDLYVTSDAYYDLISYLVGIDANWQRNPSQFPNTLNIYGVDVHMLEGAWYDPSGTKLTGTALGFDRNAMPATIYYATHPGFPVLGNENAEVNYHAYLDDKTRERNLDFWIQERTVLKLPKAMMWIRDIHN